MRALLTTLFFLLPSGSLKIRLLRLVGHDIHPQVRIGVCLVHKVDHFVLAEGANIGQFNVFRGLALVRMDRGAMIHQFNWITGDSGREEGPAENPIRRQLHMAEHAHVLSRHMLDCGGGVILEADTWMTGIRSTVFSHSFDPVNGGIMLEPVRLKRGSMVATSCTLLPGTTVGEGSLLAAGSTTWAKQTLRDGSLYGGCPARRLAPMQISDWVYQRNRYPDADVEPQYVTAEA